MPNWEPEADRGLWTLSDPRLSNPAKMRKKCCYGQKNLGQYVAVYLRLQHTSHTQPTSTLSRIKCEIYIFYKEGCSFVHWSRHYCWLLFSVYTCLCVWLYNNSLEDQPWAMNDKDVWRERERERERERGVKEIHGVSTTWWYIIYMNRIELKSVKIFLDLAF